MSTPQTPTSSNVNEPTLIRRGRVASVDLYEVKESELDILANGDSNGTYLNFSIFLLSLAFSAIASLCTSTFKQSIYQTIFIVVAVVGILIGLFLLIIWFQRRQSIKKVVQDIKNRIPPEYVIAEDQSLQPPPPPAESQPQG